MNVVVVHDFDGDRFTGFTFSIIVVAETANAVAEIKEDAGPVDAGDGRAK